MALGKQVEESLKDAQSDLRNALSFAARTERSITCKQIAELVHQIDAVITTDSVLNKLEDRGPGDSGIFGSFFVDEP